MKKKKIYNKYYSFFKIFFIFYFFILYYSIITYNTSFNIILMSFINTLSVLYLISYCLLGYKNPNRVKLFKKKKEKTKWIVTRDLFFQIVITSFFIKNSINYGLLEILQFITISLLILRLMKANEDIFFKKYKYEKILAKFFYNKKDEINNINKLKNQARFMLKKINKNNLVGESYVLQDVCLPNKIDPLSDNVFFSDYIILSSFGVFVLNFQETTGELYSKKGLFSGDWLKTIAEENKIEDYKNPFKDNYMYVKNLKMILNKGYFGRTLFKISRDFPIYSLVVFNNDVKFRIERYSKQWSKTNNVLLYLSELEDYFNIIGEKTEIHLKTKHIRAIKKNLEEENLDGLIKIKKVMEDNNIKKNKHIELVI